MKVTQIVTYDAVHIPALGNLGSAVIIGGKQSKFPLMKASVQPYGVELSLGKIRAVVGWSNIKLVVGEDQPAEVPAGLETKTNEKNS